VWSLVDCMYDAFVSCFVVIGVSFGDSSTLANPVRLLR
jgi:hypothetical protein